MNHSDAVMRGLERPMLGETGSVLEEWTDMTMSAHAKTYQLTEVLDLKAALPLAEGLLAQRGKELMIDASRVERLGAQSLQILLSAISTWRADGLSIEFVEPSQPFIQGLELLGVDPEDFLTAGHLPLGVAEAD